MYFLPTKVFWSFKTRAVLTFVGFLSVFVFIVQGQSVPFQSNIYGGSDYGIVGKISDQFDVTPTGQATYEIPISVLPGTGGISPQLSIVYNSSSSSGLLGSGFDMSGFSIINRTPSNLHVDGVARFVNFTSSDQFMLDGQRLIFIKSINSSTFEYRTENNNFSKILANGSDRGNPLSFTVYTKSGLIYEYAANTSQLKSTSTASENILFWLIRKVTDTKGNYYTVSYERDDINGEYWPTRIDYTGNDNVSPKLLPYNSVRFYYQTNYYPQDSYLFGIKVRKSKLLTKVGIYSGDKQVKYYQFAYQLSNNKYQLTSVTEYGSDGIKLNPTKFSWYNSSNFVTTKVDYNTTSLINKARLTVGDYNGDGKDDVLVTPLTAKSGWTGWRLFLSQGNSFYYAGSGSLALEGEIQEVVSGDFNGDGYDDVVIKNNRYNGKYNSGLYLSNVTGSSVSFTFKQGISETLNYSIRAVEVNGDGISDLFLWFHKSKESKIFNSLISGSMIFPLHYTAVRSCSVNWDKVEFVDFNGDGLTDVLNLHANGYYLLESDGSGTIWRSKADTWPNKDHHLYLGDFNGDGKTDMLLTGWNKDPNASGWSNWNVQFSKGNGLFERKDFTKKFNSKDKTIYVADVNGDGKDDFYAVDKLTGANSTSRVYSYLNNGTGSSFQQTNGAITYGLDKWLYYLGDFNGDCKTDFLCTANFSNVNWTGCQLFLVPESKNNLLATITDGLGNTTEISYKSMSDKNVHERGRTNTYPLVSFNANWFLVDKITTPNGLGGKNIISYKYKNALIHKRGRGVVGFECFIEKNETNFIETKTQIEVNTIQYVPAVKSIETSLSGKLLNKVEYTNALHNYGSNNKVFTFNSVASVEKKYDFNTGALISSVETATEYDEYGNVTKSVTKSGSDVITNENIYTNDLTYWFLGRLTKGTVTKSNGKLIQTRETEFLYDNVSGLLTKEIVEKTDANLGYVKNYIHDQFGNIIESKTTPNNTKYEERVIKTKYDVKGRLELESTNALGHTTKNYLDEDLCVVNYTIDVNNFKTEYSYDKFGKLLITKNSLGYFQKVIRWSSGHPDAPSRSVYFTYSESPGNPSETEFFDSLGRTLRKVVSGFNNEKIFVDFIYNAKGQVEKTSEPYAAGQTVFWNRNEYDAIGRVVKQVYADNSYFTYEYNELTTTTTDPIGQKDTKVLDSNGNLIESVDNKKGSVKYEYDLNGNCTKVTGPRTTIVTEYDKYGNRTKLIDPDLGTVEYEYNAFGELVLQKDARTNTSFQYDKLGRLLQEKRNDVTITNVFDTEIKGAISSSFTSKNISLSYKYDSYGRIIKTTENIEGKQFITETSYNSVNKVDIITYPSGLKVKNEYTGTGYLLKILNAQTKKVYWQANAINARGQLEKFTLGNGLVTSTNYNAQKGYIENIKTPGVQNWYYTFNSIGNLTGRTDSLRKLSERFDYDGLNRLWKISYNGQLKQEILYDAAGNVTFKTGVGNKFEYIEGTNRLKSVTGSGYNPIDWDDIKYSSFNKITYVKHGNNTLSLTYGVGKERKKSVTTKEGIIETKYYVGNLYEEVLVNNEVRQINYIFANGGVIALFEKSSINGEKLQYIHKDHLGSIQAFSNEKGALVQELSYDAWGRRRNPVNWSYYQNLTDANALHPRGFTGHEHIDLFEMINMNGRMYDPVLGRFLSPDPFVQAPDYTQGLNRYSYCLNNPLSLVDPSGYSWFSRNWKSLVSAIVGVAVTIISGGSASSVGAIMISGALGGASAGLTGALLNGANLGQIVKSTLTGGLWGSVGGFLANASGGGHFLEKLFKHAFSQTWLEGIRGGNMKHGLMAGITSAIGGSAIEKYGSGLSVACKVSANAVLSGTVAEVGGGKFANGAITGAFAMMFNELKHQREERRAANGVGDLDGVYFFDRDGNKLGQLEVGTNWPFEVRYVRDENISGFKKVMKSTSSIDRWNGAMLYSEKVNVKKYPFIDNLYHMVLPKDGTYWMSFLSEWGLKSLMPSPPGAPPVGHDQVHDAFYGERWKYESGVPITIP